MNLNPTPIHIARDDYSKLRILLATALHSNANGALNALRDELDRAIVIDPAAFPAGVVTMDAEVEFEDLATGAIETCTITYPECADPERKRTSILAPMGTALIGCRVGEIVSWAAPGCIRRIRILRVTPPSAELAPAAFALPLHSRSAR